MFEDGEESKEAAKVEDRVTCSACAHAWTVASVHPMTLGSVDEAQRAETD
jgi:hypothetical protein